MPTIFVVEDNPADVELLRMALAEACVECDLVLFEDGREIMDHIHTMSASAPLTPPDLILLDLNLPRNDGIEILQLIRATPALAQVPVAVLSSSSWARERARLASFQIREFIAKPPDLEQYMQIGQIIRNLL